MRGKLGLPGLSDALVLIAFAYLLTDQPPEFARDPGTGWHLMAGRWIWEHGTVPRLDPFLSGQPRPWISDQWLGDLIFYSIYRWGGWPLLYGFIAALIGTAYFIVLHPRLTRITSAPLSSCFATLLAFKLSEMHWLIRPVVFSFLCFAILYTTVYMLYFRLRDGGELRLSRYVGPTALLMLLWANLHPAFVLGLLLLILLPVGLALDRLLFGAQVSLGAITKLAFLFLAAAVATLINPYHFHLHESIVQLGRSTYFMQLHMEWLSPDFKKFEGQIMEIMLGVIVLAAFLSGAGRLRWRCFDILVVLVFSHLALSAVRMLPFFGIAASAAFAQALAALSDAPPLLSLSPWQRLKRHLDSLSRREMRGGSGALIAGITVGIILAWSAATGSLPLYAGELGPPRGEYPYSAVSFIDGQPGRKTVLAPPDWGGFLVLQSEGRIKPVIDDRNTLVGESFHREFSETMRIGSDWRGYLKRQAVSHLLLRAEGPLAQHIRSSGSLDILYEDKVAIVFRADTEINVRPDFAQGSVGLGALLKQRSDNNMFYSTVRSKSCPSGGSASGGRALQKLCPESKDSGHYFWGAL